MFLDDQERQFLASLFAKWGNQTKRKIRQAWESGDYRPLGLTSNEESILQRLRNTFGPSWLNSLKPASLE